MCSDQHVKYRMPCCGFPFASSLLLDYHVKQYTLPNTCRYRYVVPTLSYVQLLADDAAIQAAFNMKPCEYVKFSLLTITQTYHVWLKWSDLGALWVIFKQYSVD